jgi:hypothetical protein
MLEELIHSRHPAVQVAFPGNGQISRGKFYRPSSRFSEKDIRDRLPVDIPGFESLVS